MPTASLLLVAVWPITFLVLEPGDTALSIIAGSTVLVLGYVVFMSMSKEDALAHSMMRSAIGLKMAGAAAYIAVVELAYRGGADVVGSYWSDALITAETFKVTGQFNTATHLSTDFVQVFAALIYAVVGRSLTTAIILFSFLALAGQYLFYRTFRIAYPEADATLAAVLLFAYPSLLFWTSTVGKDSLMIFGLGLVAYGQARVLHRMNSVGVVCTAAGLAVQYFVRPHIAGACAICLLGAFVVAKNHMGLRGIILRSVALPLLVVGTVYLFQRAQVEMHAETFSAGLDSVEITQVGTHAGGSSFQEGLSTRVLLSPLLFQRPFPWEAHNMQAILASLEGVLSAILFWSRRRNIAAAVRRMREDSFLSFVVLTAGLLTVLLSLPFSNFGLLARERTMVLPFVLLLVAVPIDRTQRQGPLYLVDTHRWTPWRSRLQASNVVSGSMAPTGPAAVSIRMSAPMNPSEGK